MQIPQNPGNLVVRTHQTTDQAYETTEELRRKEQERIQKVETMLADSIVCSTVQKQSRGDH